MSAEAQSDIGKPEGSLSYKYQRLREQLRQAILTGELAGRLPGERILAHRYEANAKTVNKALADLAMDGLILRHVGRGSFVAGQDKATATTGAKQRTYGWVAGEADQLPSDGTACYRQAAEAVQAVGHKLEIIDALATDSSEYCPYTLTPGQLRELSGLILFAGHPSEQFLAELNRRHLPAVIANNRHATIRTPVVQADYAQGVFELTQHLIQLGHRDIRLVIDARLLPAAGDATGGHQAAMGRYGLTGREALQAQDEVDWRGILCETDRPTGLVCVGTAAAVRLVSEAIEAGLAMPDQLSLAVMPEPGTAQAAEQQFTAYEVPSDRIVDWATKLLLTASPCDAPRTVIVPGCMHVRRSTGRLGTGKMAPLATPGETIV